jgi:hypothetical protein
LGNYKDTLTSLLTWLEDTEELIANQREHSADGKVVRAQVQEQKLLMKMLDDKLPNIEAFSSLVEQMQSMAADEREAAVYGDDRKNIVDRCAYLHTSVYLFIVLQIRESSSGSA